jgi:hypothetical protein
VCVCVCVCVCGGVGGVGGSLPPTSAVVEQRSLSKTRQVRVRACCSVKRGVWINHSRVERGRRGACPSHSTSNRNSAAWDRTIVDVITTSIIIVFIVVVVVIVVALIAFVA